MRNIFTLILLVGVLGADEPYGFRGFEIYKIANAIGLLTPCDVDGDGLTDLLVVNNSKAKIEVFLRRKEPVPPKTKTGEKRPNDLVDDQFFERKEILTEKSVSTMVAGDFNGDGKVDVAFYGKPAELVVVCGDGKGAFPEAKTFPLTQGIDTAAGDLNGDGREDLVLLAKEHTAILYQSDKGRLNEPVKLPHAVKGINGVMVKDLDGDTRHDLILLSGSSSRSVRARFQQADGSLGAEVAFATSPWRVIDFADIDPAPGAEVVVVQRTSGLLRALSMQRKPAGADAATALGTIEYHAFEAVRGGKARSMAIGDVNGDGRPDVVVTEPGVAQVAVYLQDAGGGLAGRRLFPSLSNSEAVRVADLDGDRKAEVIVLSTAEKAVGVASWTEGRLPFPKLLDLPGAPKVLDVGDVNHDGRMDLVVVVEPKKGVRSAVFFAQAGKEDKAEPAPALDMSKLKQTPDDLLIMDLDQDGRNDLLTFDRYGPMRAWRASADGYVDLAAKGNRYRGGLVSKIGRGNVTMGDIDGDEKADLLVATKNFARAIVLKDGSLTVKDQANGASPRSQVKGAVALDLDGDGKAEVALFDREKKAVTVLQRDAAGVFQVAANLPVGELDYLSIFAEDLNGDGARDLVLFGKNRFGILYARGENRELKELHAVESTLRDARLGRFAVGDLNGDKQPDVAVIDSGNKSLQVFAYDAKQGFVEKIHWKVYQKKMHQSSRDRGISDVVITDLDGDGRDDVAVLVHDRLIVYPQ